MVAQRPLSPAQFNAFHHDSALFFQFVLLEFFAVHTAWLTLSEAEEALHTRKIKKNAINPQIVQVTLIQCCGRPLPFTPHFSWLPDESLLGKLNTSCAFLAQHAEEEEFDLLALHRESDKAWHNGIRSLEWLAAEDWNRLEDSLHQLGRNIHRLGKLFSRLLPAYRDDENLLWFLITHQTAFESVWGPKSLVKLFEVMYTGGVKEAGSLVMKRYTQRGFDQLIPEITSRIGQLE